MSAIKDIAPIKDKVHGYLHFARAHRLFIDSPHFQRLHNVLQNGPAYVAFPCNRNSRFAHSLGVGHLAGKAFMSSLKNAKNLNKHHFEEYIDLARDIISRICDEINVETANLKKAWDEGSFRSNSMHGICDDKNDLPDACVIDTLWFSVVLCALYHDVGHLPFSHSFEEAVELAVAMRRAEFLDVLSDEDEKKKEKKERGKNIIDNLLGAGKINIESDGNGEENTYYGLKHSYRVSRKIYKYIKVFGCAIDDKTDIFEKTHINISTDKEIHEIRGIRILLDCVFDNIIENQDGITKDFLRVIRHICACIMLSGIKGAESVNTEYSLFQSLHYIYSGYLDVDRLDYTLRDSVESGLGGSFDIDRIINNVVLFRDEGRYNYYKFYIGSLSKSISAIEEFFNRRENVWHVVVNHKCVMKAGIILKEVIARLILLSICGSENAGLYGGVVRKERFLGFIKMMDNTKLIKAQFKDESYSYKILSIFPDDCNSIIRLHDSSLVTFLENVREYIDGVDDLNDFIMIDENGGDEDIENFIKSQIGIIKILIEYFLERNFGSISHFGKNLRDEEIFKEDSCDNVYEIDPSVNKEHSDCVETFYNEIKDIGCIYVSGVARRKLPEKLEDGTHKIVIGYDNSGDPIVKELKDVSRVVKRMFSITDMHRNDFIISIERGCAAIDQYKEYLKCLCSKKGEVSEGSGAGSLK